MVEFFVQSLLNMPPELVLIIQFAGVYGLLIFMLSLFGRFGVVAFMVVATIAANILVLKHVSFSLYDHPIAMGTIVFTSTFLATDILNEYYGRAMALKAIFITFFAYFSFSLIMLIGLGFQPATAESLGENMSWAAENQEHIRALFMPSMGIFAASMIAFVASQVLDTYIYSYIGHRTEGKMMWLRNNISTIIAGTVDSTIFSIFAFMIFTDSPISVEALIFTYVLSTVWLRWVVALFDTPLLYYAGLCVGEDGIE